MNHMNYDAEHFGPVPTQEPIQPGKIAQAVEHISSFLGNIRNAIIGLEDELVQQQHLPQSNDKNRS